MSQDAGEKLKPDLELISLSWKKEENEREEDRRTVMMCFHHPKLAGVRPMCEGCSFHGQCPKL